MVHFNLVTNKQRKFFLLSLELFEAIKAEDIKAVTGILASGIIDLNYRDQFYHTPLTYAAQNGSKFICQLLLEYGADINAKDDDDWTALHHATSEAHFCLCLTLLNYGAAVDPKDKYNWTPLHFATKLGYGEICKVLLDNGADHKLKDNQGKTCRDKALSCGHDSIVELYDNKDRGTNFSEVIGGSEDVFLPSDSKHTHKISEEELALMEKKLKKTKLKIEIENLNRKMDELEKKCQRKQDIDKLILTEENNIIQIEEKIDKLIKDKINKTNVLKELNFEKLIIQQDTSIYEEVKNRKETLELQLENGSFLKTIDNKNIEIDCPICFNPMDPETEIKQCRKGHYLCCYCFMKLKEKCPQCPEKKEHFERARAVEDVIAKVFFSK